MMIVKRVLAAAMATALLASSASAAGVTPLPAGKPAGTKEAALLGLPVLLVGLAVVAVVVAVAASNDNNNPTTPTTTGT